MALRICSDVWPGPINLNSIVGTWFGCQGWRLTARIHNYALEMAPGHASGERRAVQYIGFAGTSGPEQSLQLKSFRTWCGCHCWRLTVCMCATMRRRWRPIMRPAEDWLGCTSDVLRVPARTTYVKLSRWDLVRLLRLAVNCLQLYYYASEITPDHASGEGPAVKYFGFAPTYGQDQSP